MVGEAVGAAGFAGAVAVGPNGAGVGVAGSKSTGEPTGAGETIGDGAPSRTVAVGGTGLSSDSGVPVAPLDAVGVPVPGVPIAGRSVPGVTERLGVPLTVTSGVPGVPDTRGEGIRI